jgi:hypothetical protein
MEIGSVHVPQIRGSSRTSDATGGLGGLVSSAKSREPHAVGIISFRPGNDLYCVV